MHWQQVPGKLVQVGVNDMEVWGVNSNGQIYKRPVDGSGQGWQGYAPLNVTEGDGSVNSLRFYRSSLIILCLKARKAWSSASSVGSYMPIKLALCPRLSTKVNEWVGGTP